MKIALLHDFLFTYAGAERVLSAFHELYPEAPIYTMFAYPEIVEKHFPNATVITSSLQKNPLKKWPPFLLGQMPQAVESFNFNDFDIVLSSSGAFSHGAITGPETIHICYCHTPMRYAWDWHHEYLKERGFSNLFTLTLARRVLSRLRLWDAISAERVDIWLANSGVVADRIKKFYRRDATVIYPTVNTAYFDPELVTDKKKGMYAITASRLSPNKRVHLMIAACAKAGMPLSIIGGGSELSRLEKLASDLKANVTFLGPVSEEEKRRTIAEAGCFLFAAEDDFGIAPVEALSLGVPVISLAKGGIQEVIQSGKNGILFPEPTEQALTEALLSFKDQGVDWDEQQIRHSALPYSQKRFQQEIAEIVSHAAQG
jgi:glycosyltransferase involved in cell wall biosynthesis